MDIMNSMYPTINHSYTRASESDFLVFLSIGHASFHSRHHNSWRSDKIIVLRGKSTRVQSPRKKNLFIQWFFLSLFFEAVSAAQFVWNHLCTLDVSGLIPRRNMKKMLSLVVTVPTQPAKEIGKSMYIQQWCSWLHEKLRKELKEEIRQFCFDCLKRDCWHCSIQTRIRSVSNICLTVFILFSVCNVSCLFLSILILAPYINLAEFNIWTMSSRTTNKTPVLRWLRRYQLIDELGVLGHTIHKQLIAYG